MSEANDKADNLPEVRQQGAVTVDAPQARAVVDLAALPAGAVVKETTLAEMFHVHRCTIRRAVRRGELPAPAKLFGGSCWTAGAILRHLEARQQLATQAREKELARIVKLGA